MWRCALGKKYDGLEESKKKFGESSKRAFELFGEFCISDFFPCLGWMDVMTGLVKRLRETAEGLDAFLDQVIEEYRNMQASEDQLKRKCFVAAVLQHEKEGSLETHLTQDNLKAVILDMFLGGTDTISTTLEWAMMRLMQNPTKMSKAQEEVRRVTGKKPKVEEEDILQLNYLKCIIKETLRLHAPAPLLAPRELTQSTKLQGYDIPSKTRVFINVFAIHRDPNLWDSPEEFIPERFLNNQVDFKGQDFQFIPFGAGRRGCPGIAFGVVEAEYLLANLLYWFDWKLPSGTCMEDLDMTENSGLVLHKKVPLQLVPEFYCPP
ncbi:Psoralen synthase [Bertholletia excelsa]